ncbi:hypothetical protein AB2B38_011925 [Balneola sp. MJW-20]|uniref:endonuclease/exonuclease/phosphatase family protein n=1 Tax=Gracilimonas aurantiaca TaxID=3234185 RepID=UPI003466590A
MRSVKCSLIVFSLLGLLFLSNCSDTPEEKEIYTLVTYNVENLFDADGVAIFDDYKPEDREGNSQYTPRDVLTKIRNTVKVVSQYNDGKGPDIIAMVELESDQTGEMLYEESEASDFLEDYEDMSLSQMLGESFNDRIADLPSELLLLKGMEDAGLEGYQIHVGNSMSEDGEPLTVQKNVLFSRFPINRDKSRLHPVENARSILESHLDIKGRDLIVFTNHWKSGAGSEEMEEIRKQNAGVLRKRIDELRKENFYVDFVIAGDLNSHFNQRIRTYFPETAIIDVLGSTGNEIDVSRADTSKVYNLWYELPPADRGSDTYRGEWGTLMHILVSGGMYDIRGLYYIDNSFEVGDFGFNTYSTSGQPKRWSSVFDGSGYSDHLPVSMKFTYATIQELKEGKGMRLSNPSTTDDYLRLTREVRYNLPQEYLTEEQFLSSDPRTVSEYYDEYVYLGARIDEGKKLMVGGINYDVYSPAFDIDSLLFQDLSPGDSVRFYGRWSQYRGNWQFIIEDPSFIETDL